MSKEILVNIEPQETRVVILENQLIEDFFVERKDSSKLVGSIYKGKVESVVSGIGAAFVDIGLEKNGFLYMSDATGVEQLDNLAALESGFLDFQRSHRRQQPIQNLLKKGQSILVQVLKEPIGTKGARLTTNISLPGRYLVLMPDNRHLGISKRIEDQQERERLRKALEELKLPAGMGFIVRTVAEGAKKNQLARDVKYLCHLWKNIKIRAAKMTAPALLHEEYDLLLRTVRDLFTEDVSRLIIDSKDGYYKIINFLNLIQPPLKTKVEYFTSDTPLFEKMHIEDKIAKIYDRKVKLPSGGYIIIEPTESLVAIDVNTGSFTGKRNPEETIYKTNLEATKEIARQIRLRDLGGIIVVDFIDMNSKENRHKVYSTLKDALERDKAKTNILGISEIGLVEMTRQRIRKSIESISYKECPYCQGRGSIKSPITVSIEVLRRIKRCLKETRNRLIEIRVHPEVAARLFNEDRSSITYMEKRFRVKVNVVPDAKLHVEDIEIKAIQ